MGRIRVISFGLGPIGLGVARLLLGKRGAELVGAVDNDPAKVGRDLHDLLELPGKSGITVEADAGAVIARTRPDAAIHCTASFLPAVESQLVALARAGVDVVSSTEELLVPDQQHHEIAARIDAAARAGNATVLGTGVNPGFAMDFLAVVATAACADVRRVRCVRVVDAATRRFPLQRKVGASMTREEFERERQTGRFGHIGMRESVAMIGRALQFELDDITQTLEPVLATRELRTQFMTVPAGSVAGIHNVGRGTRAGDVVVELDLGMYVGAPDPRDEVFLWGTPDLHVAVPGGVPGDLATAAILINWLPQVVAARPGLHTVLDLPPARLLR
jgi:4-hydroxy-tetrahydrodipicolinate reductase